MNEICIVIPCYNEAGRLREEDFTGIVEKYPEIALCLVNDGSIDKTEEILKKIRDKAPGKIILKNLEKNMGKAEAVRKGMLEAINHYQSEYFGYFDADMATPPEESLKLRAALQAKPTLEYAFGSRVGTLGVKIERKLYRHLIGRVIATFISNILHLMVYDTQCGAKLFKRGLAVQVFEKPFITRWLFDVEILARILGIFGRAHIEEVAVEVPVGSWIDRGKSKVSWTYGFRIFYDLIRIRRHYRKNL